ncbi:hypothetical protein [Paenibacillus sp. YAF4_2]|uniref:hypothetical protein n=1 Tax=Paenibacillus sp. YAF4_2 TaxID=3233085 RepID=UPI003F99F2C2
MSIILIIAVVVITLGIISIDGKLKKRIDNDERIIERLEIIINNQREKDKME